MNEYYDVIIVGTGAAGLYCALMLPERKKILMLTKQEADLSDSFLAQGGICMLRGEDDYKDYFEDTMRAGHYENNERAVDLMIRSSNDIIRDLVFRKVDFARTADGELDFTREGAHSRPRILFHKDITGKEITSTLLKQVLTKENIEIREHMTMVDLIEKDNICGGVVAMDEENHVYPIRSQYVVLACGGIGGLYQNSTNYPHIAGDGLGIAMKHQVEVEHLDYIQIHPTTLYSEKPEDRSFLISESVRGEGAKLYDKNMNRFVNELLPRDLLTEAILAQMEKDQTEFVWEDLRTIPENELKSHFPNIVEHCREMGYDVTKECIPVVPAQHYFMGGIRVNHRSRTSMEQLYAVGETACNGVHGKNRLASNSLLESLVFAKRAAKDMQLNYPLIRKDQAVVDAVDLDNYENEDLLEESYRKQVLKEIEKANQASKSA